MLNKKHLAVVFSVFLCLFLVGTVFTSLLPQKARAATTDPARDLERRKYATFLQCLDKSVIDEDDDIEDYGDLFDNNEDEKEVIVVGIDRDSSNGVMSCDTVIRQGVTLLEPGVSDHRSWLIKELTGSDFSNSNGSISNSKIEENRQKLFNRVKAKRDAYEGPDTNLRARRFQQLITYCYDVKPVGATLSEAKDPDRDFERPGIGTFMFKDDLDDDSIGMLKQSGGGGNVHLGDIQLGFASGNSLGVGDWNPFTSDWFPIGSDIGQTNGYTKDAIVDCEFVYKNQNMITTANTQVNSEGDLVDPATGEVIAEGDPTDEEAAKDDSCESKSGALGWIMCPVVLAIDGVLNWVDTRIQAMLNTPETSYDNQGMYNAWSKVRDIAYIILIPVMLVMVIGTAIGTNAFDAYTVKKALPRMAIAVIFITLSWYVCIFLIGLSNVVGGGTLGIMTQPFGETLSGGDDGVVTLSDFFEGNILTGIATGAVGIIGLPILLWLFGGTILLFVGMAFLVLLIRQMFILALMLVAPLAILAWIFPGNDKLWKSWWSAFSKLLIMYPLIMALIAVGRIFAFVISQEDGGGLDGAIIEPMLILGAYMVPYAFIPFTFKFAGGIFATVAGGVNDRSKGLFDRQRNKRAENWKGFKAGTKAPPGLRGNSFAAAGMRRVGSGIGAGWKGKAGFGQAGLAARATALETAAHDVTNTDEWKANQENDHVLRAAASGLTENEAVRNMVQNFGYNESQARDYVRQAKGTIGLGRAQQIAAAKQLVNTNTGYENLEQMTRTLGLAAGGNRSTANALAGYANATTKKVGRSDLAPGYTTLAGLVEREAMTPGSVDAYEYEDSYDEAIRTQGIGAILGGKAQAVNNVLPAMQRRIDRSAAAVNAAHATGNAQQIADAEREHKQVLASTAASLDVAGQLSPEIASTLADGLMDHQSTILGQTTTVSRRIEHLRSDQEFGQMRREYAQQQGAAATTAQAQAAAQAAAQQALAQQQNPQQGGNPLNPGGIGSDSRIKRNVHYLYTSSMGNRVYRFQYLWSDVEYVGVIAQEVMKTNSDAVIRGVEGFYRVDYSKLDVDMMTYEEWVKQRIIVS